MATPKKNCFSSGTDFLKFENQPTFSFHLKASRAGSWIGGPQQGLSFFCLQFVVARSDYARYDIGPFPIRPQLPMRGVFPCWQKFFQNQIARLVTPRLDPLVIVVTLQTWGSVDYPSTCRKSIRLVSRDAYLSKNSHLGPCINTHQIYPTIFQ